MQSTWMLDRLLYPLLSHNLGKHALRSCPT
jgi:hypothetical protein